MAVFLLKLVLFATTLIFLPRYVQAINHFVSHPVQIYTAGRVQSITLIFSTVVKDHAVLYSNITSFLASRPVFKGPDKDLYSMEYEKKVAQVKDILGECQAYIQRLQKFKKTVRNMSNLRTHPCSIKLRPFDNFLPGNVASLLDIARSKLENTDIETAFRWLGIIQFDVQQLTKKMLEYIITLSSVKQEILFGIYMIPMSALPCELFRQYNVKNIDCNMVNEDYYCNFDIVEKVQVANARRVYAIPYNKKTFLKTPLFLIDNELRAGNCPERDFCDFKDTNLPTACENDILLAVQKRQTMLSSCPLYDESATMQFLHNMPVILQDATLSVKNINYTLTPPTLLYLNESAVLYMKNSTTIRLERNSEFFHLDKSNLTDDQLSIYTDHSDIAPIFESFLGHVVSDWPTLLTALAAYLSIYFYTFLGGLCRRKHFDRQQRRILKGKQKTSKNPALVAFLGNKK